MSALSRTHKLLPLEALRGCAALVVVLNHFLLGFQPWIIGNPEKLNNPNSLLGTPFYILVNGMAAVIIFFVMSGYVLSLKGLRTDAVRAIADSALKRWFRLFPIVTLSVLLSCLLFRLGLFYHQEAARLTRSQWMYTFASGRLPQSYNGDFWEAFLQGSILTFYRGDGTYNSNLWTMRWEFYGSFLTFALALFLPLSKRWVFWLTMAGASSLLFVYFPILLPFVIGVGAVGLGIHNWRFQWPSTLAFLLTGLYICGYTQPIEAYEWVGIILPTKSFWCHILILSLGAFFLLVVFASQNPISARFNGSWSRLLGRISFPLYLVHLIIVLSVGAGVYVSVGNDLTGFISATLATLAAIVALTWLFCLFDEWWVRQLNRRKVGLS